MEAITDPVRAKNFGSRLKRLITDAKGQERVRVEPRELQQ